MSTSPESSPFVTPDKFEFAILQPLNAAARKNLVLVNDRIRLQPTDSSHHIHFIRQSLPSPVIQEESPRQSPDPSLAPDPAVSSDNVAASDASDVNYQGCFALSLNFSHPPLQPKVGWVLGTGRRDLDSKDGLVDLLMADSAGVCPRHLRFFFDELGRLQLRTRHKGVSINGQRLRANDKHLLPHHCYINISNLQYRFQFIVPRDLEATFQEQKSRFFRIFGRENDLSWEQTSITPSPYDTTIGDWRVHAIAGLTVKSTVQAASNSRTTEAVAIKRLLRHDSRSAAAVKREIATYEGIKNVVAEDWRSRFVMLLHSVLYQREQEWQHGRADEVFLLWTPLGSSTLQDFEAPRNTKSEVLVQIIHGLAALHVAGWAHRDIKPLNIYVVRTKPIHVVLGDFGAAIRIGQDGMRPEPGTCGTIGWLAPELENEQISPTYSHSVDIWSVGAVGYFLFFDKMGVWGMQPEKNPWLNYSDPLLMRCKSVIEKLLASPDASIGSLLGAMLDWRPEERLSLEEAIQHPALAAYIRADKPLQVGLKRSNSELI